VSLEGGNIGAHTALGRERSESAVRAAEQILRAAGRERPFPYFGVPFSVRSENGFRAKMGTVRMVEFVSVVLPGAGDDNLLSCRC
jgi:hypothetical protein